jgi:hypothetical protein
MENISADKYAISTAWLGNKDFKKPFDYALKKSGQTVRIARLDMSDLLKLGVANELDFMTKALITGEDNQDPQQAVAEAVTKSDNYSRLETMINKVVLAGVIQPNLHAVPEHENARQDGLFYVDYIPWDDRMELFSVIFETEGISDFREEQEPGVGNVPDVQTLQLPSDEPVADVRPSQPEGVLSQ